MSLSAGFEFPKAVNQSESDIPDTGPFLHPRLHDGIVVADPGNAGLFQTCVLGEWFIDSSSHQSSWGAKFRAKVRNKLKENWRLRMVNGFIDLEI